MGATPDGRAPGPAFVSRPAARSPDAPGMSARRGALRMLDAVLLKDGMLEDAAATGSGAERAEARGLADLTLRRLGQVDDVLGRFVQRPPKGAGRQILRLMAGGYSNKEIANSLGVAEGTVKNHVSNILSKLGVRDRTRAVLKAFELGFV